MNSNVTKDVIIIRSRDFDNQSELLLKKGYSHAIVTKCEQ